MELRTSFGDNKNLRGDMSLREDGVVILMVQRDGAGNTKNIAEVVFDFNECEQLLKLVPQLLSKRRSVAEKLSNDALAQKLAKDADSHEQ